MAAAKKDLPYYLTLPYSCELTACEGGGYFARHPDLDGCAVQGDDVEEALVHLQTARELWLEGQLETGAQVPEPPSPEPSGRLMLRVPLRLHAELERHAAMAGLSLNRLLNETLFDHANGLPFGYGLERLTSDESRAVKALESGEPQQAQEHLSRMYPYLLTPAEEGGYAAEHPDLPGCTAAGASAAEAIAELDVARSMWIAGRIEDGLPLPAPLPPAHSGIINLRMPTALHYQLAREATRNGVSLNQWLNMALAEFAGAAAVQRGTRPQHLPAADLQRHVIRKAVPLLRQAPHGPCRNWLESLPSSHADFLSGLLDLERRAFEAAFSSFSAARAGRLNFGIEAVRIYRAMPDRLTHRQLLDLLMQLSHTIPGDTPERAEIHLLLGAWLERVRENPISHRQWVRWGRAKRRPAEISHRESRMGSFGNA